MLLVPVVKEARAGARRRSYPCALTTARKRTYYDTPGSADPDSLHSFSVSLSFIRVV